MELLKFVSHFEVMYENDTKNFKIRKCFTKGKRFLIYKWIITIIIICLQLYSLIYPFVTKLIPVGEFVAYLVIKLLFMRKILTFNFIDIIIHWPRVKKIINEKKVRIFFWITFALYVLSIIAVIGITILSKKALFPNAKGAIFIENNEVWEKFANYSVHHESFCSSRPYSGISLLTDDYAMMTALPRLYGATKDGKCYLKPSMRGLFNTTMKYIFGKNYENDGINIICHKLNHNILLVITSDKILEETINYRFYGKNITRLNKQFNIKNKNYFELNEIGDLPTEGQELLNDYKNCVNVNGTSNCELKWDNFTQFYWTNMFTDDYIDIPGFERYQINLDKNTKINASFTVDDEPWAGTHIIVGGGYEDRWNVGFFIETVSRTFIPILFENILPFYSIIRGYAKADMLKIEWVNDHVFLTEDVSKLEYEELNKLIDRFDFNHQSLFMVGHSITATAFKVNSYLTNIQGISFEGAISDNNMMSYRVKDIFEKDSFEDSIKITNIYSSESYFSSNDENCDVNGMLPKRYNLPHVYNTACLTSITCSHTLKYVPFCHQVIAKNNEESIKEFNECINNYNKHYGLNNN